MIFLFTPSSIRRPLATVRSNFIMLYILSSILKGENIIILYFGVLRRRFELVTDKVMPKEMLRNQQDDLKVKTEQQKSNNNMRCSGFPVCRETSSETNGY